MRDSGTKKIAYERPTLKMVGTVYGLTEGIPGGTVPDAVLILHPRIS
jgi:hypothetical protein